jgi:putative transposase
MSWPHAPAHHFAFGDTFFITGATHHKQQLYRSAAALDELQELLFAKAEQHECALQAWSLLSNHYHLIARGDGDNVRRMVARLHTESANALNRRDGAKGRQVWFQFWDKTLTFERSWLARLRYTHENAVHHGIVDDARRYRWCSASWFEGAATPAFAATVARVKIDTVKVYDEFSCAGFAGDTKAAATTPPHS